MLNFDSIVNGLMENEDAESFLLSFFTKDNYRNYLPDDDLDNEERKALKYLFTSKEDLVLRLDEVLNMDSFCKEAIYAYMATSDDLYLSYRFEEYYKQAVNYGDMTAHQQKIYIIVLDWYGQFMEDIGNYTKAIKIWNMRYKLTRDEEVIKELSELYFELEMADELYRLYLYNEFDLREYLLLIITLLKHDDLVRAEEVTKDMYEKIDEAKYFGNYFRFDVDEKTKEFFEDIYRKMEEDICQAPELFSFIAKVKDNI
ncbi:MAG: hypothetical protein Q4D13_07855 [Erysipelotrichaceae bacterium]|nr:hypothetical protein [Erysipelotrichaceae bacterium]